MNCLFILCLCLTCVIASDFAPKRLSNNSSQAEFDFSYLDDVESVQKECADFAKTILGSMAKIPEKTLRGEKLFTSCQSSKDLMVVVNEVARKARKFLPSGSKDFEKMQEIENVSRKLQSEIESFILESELANLPKEIESFCRKLQCDIRFFSNCEYRISLKDIENGSRDLQSKVTSLNAGNERKRNKTESNEQEIQHAQKVKQSLKSNDYTKYIDF